MSEKFGASSEPRTIDHAPGAEATREMAPGKRTRTAELDSGAPEHAVQRKASGSPRPSCPAGSAGSAGSAATERAGDWAMSDGMISAMGLGSDAAGGSGHGAVQRKAAGAGAHRAVQAAGGDLAGSDVAATADRGVAGASSQLPHLDTIQQSFGRHDVSGIRAQVGGEAASASRELGAEAYATGDRVGFAQSPDLHTAAHEAAHVVQQAGGGVQLKDGIGRAGDIYEQHADAVADAVVAGKSAEGLLDGFATSASSKSTSEPATAAGPQRKAVQRKVGFEFESQGENAWRFHARDSDQENWAGIKHTKEIILPTPNRLAGLGADTGRVEVITRPLSTWEEIVATFQEINALLGGLASKQTELGGADNAFAKSVTGMNFHRVTGKSTFAARPQATIGVAPLNTEALFQRLMAMNARPQDEAEQALSSNTLVYQMGASIEESHELLQAALVGRQPREYEGMIYEEMSGALMLIMKTLWDAYSNSSNELTDAKYAFPMMPRTDFKSMLNSLEPGASDLLIDLWNGGGGPLATELNNRYPLSARVFPDGYKDVNKKKQRGPTKLAWLNSIFNGGDAKDLLSPPPGYPAHQDTARPEGLGAYGADNHLALFELRDIMGKGTIPISAWLPLATKVAELVATVEKDDALMPR